MLDIHAGSPVRRLARLTVPTQRPVPKLTGERLIRPLVAECGDLGPQHRRRQMRIIGEPLRT
jgi:hypothetical protein